MDRERAAIVLGAMAGATSRWVIGELVAPSAGWPWATLTVNIAGTLLLGALIGSGKRVRLPLRVGLAVGFCGSLTTFSTFAVETATYLRDGRILHSGAYVIVSFGIGIAAFLTGRRLVAARS